MIQVCDGFIFVDKRRGPTDTVDVYREPWMAHNTVCIVGDKGQAAALLRKPTLLIDDKPRNIDRFRYRSRPECKLDGVLKWNSLRYRSSGITPERYKNCDDPGQWEEMIGIYDQEFGHEPAGDARASHDV